MSTKFKKIRSELFNSLRPANPGKIHSLLTYLEFRGNDFTQEDVEAFITDSPEGSLDHVMSFVVAVCEQPASALDPKTETTEETDERLEWVIDTLGLSKVGDEIRRRMPKPVPTVIIGNEFRDWYTPEREARNPHYWDSYRSVLERKGWGIQSIKTVENQARQVLKRIEDPTAEHYLSHRGLVVGYVQSGKTANFTAVAAKAIDAGYRMVIVLAGTLTNLREQTQRRLDKELIGREAILNGIDEANMSKRQRSRETYFDNDEEWERTEDESGDIFVSHGPSWGTPGFPEIKRITSSKHDYGAPNSHNSELVFNVNHGDAAVHDPKNLDEMPCMFAVVKKQADVLAKLQEALSAKGNKDPRFKDLPVLIIDDEADLASINTKKNDLSVAPEDKDRTRINELITGILKTMPRAQYVGYTATPFANVFIDPDDPGDLYPRNFVLMLDKPDGYRGAEWFHDRLNFTDDDEEPTIDNCRSEAFIRYLAEELVVDEENTSEAQLQAEKEAFFEEHRCELQRALDMFVLTGAVKKYREEKDPELSFKHHTMLVHEGVDTHLHDETTRILRELWTTRGYGAGLPIPQMQELFEKDVLPVMKAGDGSWSEDWPVPESWQELQPYIIKAYEEITTDTSESGGSPILQINTGDNSDEMPNFESGKVWKVLVGGAKLSRGYTVEGLTVSYFRRRTVSADTLMQTGRWFGFRKGYQDLVRLYAPETLVDAFEAAMVDEETFRYNARVYAGFGEGALTPADLPPLVQQSLPWLAPTAREKRFNVYPVSAACGPETKEFNGIPARSNRQALADNFTGVAQPLLQTLSADIAKLAFFREEGAKNGKLRYSTGQIQAHCGLMSSSDFVDLLGKMQWTTEGSFKENVVNPRLEYLRNLLGRGSHANPDASDFSEIVVLLPHLKNNPKMIDVPGVDFKVPLVQRSRRVGRADITGGDRKLMYVAQNIAAGNDCRELGSEDAEKMGITLPQYSDEPEPFPMTPERMNNRGAVIVTLFDDRDPEILKQMKDSGTWTVPDFTAGEVGLALAVNSPLEPIKGFEDVIELRVIKRNADNTYDATIDVRDVPANV